jgi:hypothetical protein
LGFLELPLKYEPLDFMGGKNYESFFGDHDAQVAVNFVREVASPKTWDLVRRYFDKWLDELAGEPVEASTMDATVEDTNHMDEDNQKLPEVAWLLSFPNSVREPKSLHSIATAQFERYSSNTPTSLLLLYREPRIPLPTRKR